MGFILNAQIRIGNPIYDIGEVFEEKGLVYATFRLDNPYFNDTIKILDVTTSCGCTTVVSEDSVITPRSAIKLTVSYDPLKRIGLFSKTIHVKTRTGKYEENSLYLQIIGNVIGDADIKTNIPVSLIDYKVAPIYFFPVTTNDTSYFDMNKVVDFANDLTFEVDYYSFSTVGFEIRIRDKSVIGKFEVLVSYFKHRFIRAMMERGYRKENIVFTNPVVIYDNTIPRWSVAKLKVFSVKFNNNRIKESVIKMTNTKKKEKEAYILNYDSRTEPEAFFLVIDVDRPRLETKLFKDGELNLNGKILVPESVGLKKAKKIAKKFDRALYKHLKGTSGLSRKEFHLDFDTIALHAATNYRISLWDKQDFKSESRIKYVERPEEIVPPLLPTYKAPFFSAKENIDVTTIKFKHFWEAILAYVSPGKNLKIILESSASKYPKTSGIEPYLAAKQKGEKVARFIKERYFKVTGKKLNIELITTVQGPEYDLENFSKSDYYNYDYVKLVPVFTDRRKISIKPIQPKPYIVNYDYYYIGVDSRSIVFRKFCEYLVYEIETNGFVNIRTESSASNLIVDERKSNEYWAYSHLEVSKNRLFDYLRTRLIDPNRVIISNEKIVVQGMPFDRRIPVLRYRKFQFVTFVPVKYL